MRGDFKTGSGTEAVRDGDSSARTGRPPKRIQARPAPRLARRLAKASHGGAGEKNATPVRAQLAQKLRCLITDGIYKAGDRPTERELCERLRVSRPSVREALRQLEAEGLIDILPNRGPIIKMIGVKEVLELWEVRTALETLIARRFALHGTESQIERLETAISDFDSALQSGDIGYIKSAKTALYEAFASGSNSEVLVSYFRQVSARLSMVWSSSLLCPGRPAESITELFTLLATIKNRNPAAAEAAILLHMENGKAIAMYGLRVFEESRRSAEDESRKLVGSRKKKLRSPEVGYASGDSTSTGERRLPEAKRGRNR